MRSPLDLYCACQPGRRCQRGVQYLNCTWSSITVFLSPARPTRPDMAWDSHLKGFPFRASGAQYFCVGLVVFFWRVVASARPGWFSFVVVAGVCCLVLWDALGPLGASACPGLSPFLLAVVCLLALWGLCPPRCFSLLLFSYTFGVCSLAAPCGFCSRLVYMSDRLPD